MTSDILKRAAEAVEGTTPGPWIVHEEPEEQIDICAADRPVGQFAPIASRDMGYNDNVDVESRANFDFFAAARTLIPDMAAAIAERDAEIERLNHLFDLSQKTTEAVLARTESAEMETMEQARLNGMGAERELALMAERDRWRKMADRLAVALKETSDSHMSLAHDSYDGCWTIEDFDSESAVATEALAAHAAMKEGR